MHNLSYIYQYEHPNIYLMICDTRKTRKSCYRQKSLFSIRCRRYAAQVGSVYSGSGGLSTPVYKDAVTT